MSFTVPPEAPGFNEEAEAGERDRFKVRAFPGVSVGKAR